MYYRLNKIKDWFRRRGNKRDTDQYIRKLASMCSENRRIMRALEGRFFKLEERVFKLENKNDV